MFYVSNNSLDYNLLKTFCQVAESGSFTKAAQALKQPKSRVSRAINRLEAKMSSVLIRRTTRSFSLTGQGRQLFDELRPLFTKIEHEFSRVHSQSNEVSGLIRLTSPDDFATYFLNSAISEFNKLYPNVTFHLDLSSYVKDLVQDNFDLAFRIGRLKDSTYIQKHILDINLALVATPDYLKQSPKIEVKKDLYNHKLLLLKVNEEVMKLRGIKNQPHDIMTCTQFPFLYQLVKSHLGIGLIPDFYCQEDIREGNVMQLFPDWSLFKTKLHLVYPSSKNLPKRVRLFIDFLKNR